MKYERDAAVGDKGLSSLPPCSLWGGDQRDKTGTGRSRAPEMRETKGKQTGLEPSARCCVCPPPSRAGMMDGCSQPARPPGRPRYLHNTGVPPVTSDTALPGAKARWPRSSSSHRGTVTACEDGGSAECLASREPWARVKAGYGSLLPARYGGGSISEKQSWGVEGGVCPSRTLNSFGSPSRHG